MKKFSAILLAIVACFAFSVQADEEIDDVDVDSIEVPEGAEGRAVVRTGLTEVSTMEDLVTTEVREEIENAFSINDFYRVNNLGSYYYRTKQYEKAFPYLLASAKRGFKGAQYRLGVIYVNGLGGIERDVILGIGWFGCAASPRSNAGMKETFKELMAQVPERVKPKVQDIVDALIERYGSEATGVSCMNTRVAGTHMRSFQCNFDKEFEYRDAFYQDWLSTSFQGVDPYNTGLGSSDPSGQASPDAGVSTTSE